MNKKVGGVSAVSEDALRKSSKLLAKLIDKDVYYAVRLAVLKTQEVRQMGDIESEPTFIPDQMNAKSGLKRINQGWRHIDRAKAFEYLKHVIGCGIAHPGNIIPDEEAESLAEAFLSLFGEEASFFTNWTKKKLEGRDPARYCGTWAPVSESTFDFALCASDSRLTGLICFEDED